MCVVSAVTTCTLKGFLKYNLSLIALSIKLDVILSFVFALQQDACLVDLLVKGREVQGNLRIMDTLVLTRSVQIIKVSWSFYTIKSHLGP